MDRSDCHFARLTQLQPLKHGDSEQPPQASRGILHAAFSADGRRLATASLDRTARIWDAETGRDRIGARLWNAASGAERFSPLEHYDAVHAAFSPAGRQICGRGHAELGEWQKAVQAFEQALERQVRCHPVTYGSSH